MVDRQNIPANERHALIDDMANEVGRVVKQHLADSTKTCINCDYFAEQRELCTMVKPNARPPARIIAFGCEMFTETIPF